MSSSVPIHLHLNIPQRDPSPEGDGTAASEPIRITLELRGAVETAATAPSRPVAKVLAVAAVFVMAVGVGWLATGHGGGSTGEPARAALATSAEEPDGQAVLEQLKAPPRVIPPPGSPTAGAKPGGPAVFGLR